MSNFLKVAAWGWVKPRPCPQQHILALKSTASSFTPTYPSHHSGILASLNRRLNNFQCIKIKMQLPFFKGLYSWQAWQIHQNAAHVCFHYCTSRGAQTAFIHMCLNECVYYEGGSVIPPSFSSHTHTLSRNHLNRTCMRKWSKAKKSSKSCNDPRKLRNK